MANPDMSLPGLEDLPIVEPAEGLGIPAYGEEGYAHYQQLTQDIDGELPDVPAELRRQLADRLWRLGYRQSN